MRGLLITLMTFSVLGCSSLDMNTLQCRDIQVTNKTTLKQIQDTCLISYQTARSSGLYEVQFRNDSTKKTVKCDFATDSPDAVVNGCR